LALFTNMKMAGCTIILPQVTVPMAAGGLIIIN